jgi:hypothetical protein
MLGRCHPPRLDIEQGEGAVSGHSAAGELGLDQLLTEHRLHRIPAQRRNRAEHDGILGGGRPHTVHWRSSPFTLSREDIAAFPTPWINARIIPGKYHS